MRGILYCQYAIEGYRQGDRRYPYLPKQAFERLVNTIALDAGFCHLVIHLDQVKSDYPFQYYAEILFRVVGGDKPMMLKIECQTTNDVLAYDETGKQISLGELKPEFTVTPIGRTALTWEELHCSYHLVLEFQNAFNRSLNGVMYGRADL